MEGNRYWQEQIPLNYHYTNGTVFQVDIGSEETDREKKNNERKVCDEDITIKEVYGTFKLRKCCHHLSHMKIRKMKVFQSSA